MDSEYLRSIFKYDNETGSLVWLPRVSAQFNSRFAGKAAGCVNDNSHNGKGKYIEIRHKGTGYLAHRLVWAYFNDIVPLGLEIDHIDGDSLNNTICNLRVVSRSENCKNVRIGSRNISGVLGVCKIKNGRWMAQIQSDNKNIYLGTYEKKADAIKVRQEATIKYGFHKNHGSEMS